MIATATTFFVLLLQYGGLSHGKAFGLIVNFTGAVCNSVLAFILPAVFYLKTNDKESVQYKPAIALLFFGVFMMTVVPITLILYAI